MVPTASGTKNWEEGTRARWFSPGSTRAATAVRACKPRSALVQGSTRAYRVGDGDTRAPAAPPSPAAPVPASRSRRPVWGIRGGQGRGVRNSMSPTSPRDRDSLTDPALDRRTSKPPGLRAHSHTTPTLSHLGAGAGAGAGTHKRVRAQLGPRASWWVRFPRRAGAHACPHYAAGCGPRPPTSTPERCVHTQTAGRGRRRLTPRGEDAPGSASHPLPLHASLPSLLTPAPLPQPENSTKPNSQRRPDERLRPPIVF